MDMTMIDKPSTADHVTTVSLKRQRIDIAALIAAGVRKPGWENDFHFMRVPRSAAADAPVWRIILTPVGGPQRLLPLEIAGDVILGTSMGKVETNADVDLCLWDAEELGVSRHHLRLRPGNGKLFAIDLGAKNGSHINGLRLSPSQTTALKHSDYLSLGGLNMRVFFLSQPG